MSHLKPAPWFTPFQKLWLIALALIAIGWIAYRVSDLLLPFALSFILAYLLNPLTDRFEALFKSRFAAVTALYVIFIALIVVSGVVWFPTAVQETIHLSKNFPEYILSLKSYLLKFRIGIEREYPILTDYKILEYAQSFFTGYVRSASRSIPDVVFSVISIVSYLSLVPVLLFFFLLDGPELRKGLLKFVPNRYFEVTVFLMHNVGWQLGNYLRAIALEIVVVGVLSAVAFQIVGVDYAYLLGGLAGIANIIPYLGPFIGAIPAVIVFYLKVKTINSVIVMVVLCSAIQFIDNVIIKTVIFSQTVDLHPFAVVIVLILGGIFGGVWGLIFAVPIAGILNVSLIQISKEIKFRNRVLQSERGTP